MLPGQAVRSPVLIGRQPYLEQLTLLLAQAQRGHGQVALVTGEAGLGKSRLLAEASQWAREAGWLVLQGNCFEQDRTLPYAPLLDLRHHLTAPRARAAQAMAYGLAAANGRPPF